MRRGRAVHGSLRHPGVELVLYGTVGCSRVLLGYLHGIAYHAEHARLVWVLSTTYAYFKKYTTHTHTHNN